MGSKGTRRETTTSYASSHILTCVVGDGDDGNDGNDGDEVSADKNGSPT